LNEIEGIAQRIGWMVKEKMNEFKEVGKDEDSAFKELCYCLLTANFKAEGAMIIQESIGDGFFELRHDELVERLRKLGYRYPRARAGYILGARWLHGPHAEVLYTRGCGGFGGSRRW